MSETITKPAAKPSAKPAPKPKPIAKPSIKHLEQSEPTVLELVTAAPVKMAPTPMDLLSMAVAQDAPFEKLATLMDLQERWEAREARRAFVSALAAFKADPPKLGKNKLVDYTTAKGRTSYKHATLDGITDVLNPALSRHGLSFRWDIQQGEKSIHVTCILQHHLGHFENVTMSGSQDETGQKNALQQMGSTVTYLMRYTLLAITGMSTSDQDTDAQTMAPTGGAAAAVDPDQIERHIQAIRTAKDVQALSKAFNAAYALARHQGDKTDLIEAKNQRQRELQKDGPK